MDTLSYTELRANLKDAIDRAVSDHEPITVKRSRGGDAVLLSKDDYNSLVETAYLLRSPTNAKRLLTAAKRTSKKRKTFASVEELKIAFGL